MKVRLKSALLMALTSTVAMPAYAQDRSDANPTVLAPIVVRGEKVARTQKQTASSVAVLSKEDFDRRVIGDVRDLAGKVANVTMVADGRELAIRGVPKAGLAAVEDVLTQSAGDVVTTFIDGVPVSTWGGPSSTWDIESIEVLRGPQTTYSGRGSLGGAIQIYTPDPTDEWTFASRGEAANFGTQTASALVSGPLSADAGIRLSLDYGKTDGFIDNLTARTNQNPDRKLTFKGRFKFEPTDYSSFALSWLHFDGEKGGGLASISRSKGTDYVAVANIPERLEKRVDAIAFNGRYEVSPVFWIESLSTLNLEDAARSVDGDTTAADLLRANVKEDLTQYSQEVKLVYDDPDAGWRGFAGLYVRHFDKDSRNLIRGLLNVDNNVALTTDTLSVFGEATVDVTDQFHLTAGGRLEHESFDASFREVFGNASSSTEGNYTVPLPRISVGYDLTEALTAVASIQRGYRGGGAGASVLSATPYVVDPEYTWNYEAGLKGEWLAGDLTGSLIGFHTDWRNQQVSQRTRLNVGFDQIVVNAGRSEIDGLEAELRYRIVPEIEIYGGGSLLRTKFTQFVSGGQNFTGNQFPYAPRYMLNAGFNYLADNGVFAGAGVTYQGASFSDVANTPANKLDPRAIVDLSAGYNFGSVTASAFVKNVFNKEYALVKASSSDLMAPGTPRTFGLQIRGTF